MSDLIKPALFVDFDNASGCLCAFDEKAAKAGDACWTPEEAACAFLRPVNVVAAADA